MRISHSRKRQHRSLLRARMTTRRTTRSVRRSFRPSIRKPMRTFMQPDELAHHVIIVVKSALAPTLERLAAIETRVALLADVRDRLVVVETKQQLPQLSPQPPQPSDADAAALVTRVQSLEVQ